MDGSLSVWVARSSDTVESGNWLVVGGGGGLSTTGSSNPKGITGSPDGCVEIRTVGGWIADELEACSENVGILFVADDWLSKKRSGFLDKLVIAKFGD